MARKTSDWITTYLAYTAPLEAPDKFHFWTAVSAIAGALRRRVWLDMGLFRWTPNFYIIFVAPPGIVSKSTTLSVGMRFLRKVPDVHFGPDAVTWPALTQALAASRIDYPIDGMLVPMSCITIASSEFGTFLNPHDREMVDVMVDLWDDRVGSWEKRTKTSGSDSVVNPWINLAACTTPGWIAGNFPEYLIGGGFTSRCVFVYADTKRRLVPYPSMELPDDFKKLEADLQADLIEIARMAGKFELTAEAKAFGVQWYEDHYKNANKQLSNNQFAGYLARKQTHVHKLAMILEAACSDKRVISVDKLRIAAHIITSLEIDMPMVFSHIGSAGDAKNSMSILDIMKSFKMISKRELFRHVGSRMSLMEFDNAMAGAIAMGYVKVEQRGSHLYYIYTPDEVKPDESNTAITTALRSGSDHDGTGG